MFEYMIIGLLVLCAVAYLVFRLLRKKNGEGCACGCAGCSAGCGTSATCDSVADASLPEKSR